MFLDVINPLARRIEVELSRKLETPVSIAFEDSDYYDIQRLSAVRTRALIDAGMPSSDAAYFGRTWGNERE